MARHRGAFTSMENLEAAIQDYITKTNSLPMSFVLTKSVNAILASAGRFGTQICNSDH